MAITKDSLLRVNRNLLIALKNLLDRVDLPEQEPVMKAARKAVDEAEDLMGEELP